MNKPIVVRLMGMDVSLSNTGYVVLEAQVSNKAMEFIRPLGCGVICVTYKCDNKLRQNVGRCYVLAGALMEVAKKYSPTVLVSEMPIGGGKSFHAVQSMALSTGVVSAFATLTELPMVEVSPHLTKKAAGVKASSTQESKRQVEEWVKRELKETELVLEKLPCFLKIPKSKREHVVDAMGAILVAKQSCVGILTGCKPIHHV